MQRPQKSSNGIVELNEQQAGLVYNNGKLTGVLAPGKRQLYWKGAIEVRVVKVELTEDLAVRADVARLMAKARRLWQHCQISSNDV
jgi:hypothetical protein